MYVNLSVSSFMLYIMVYHIEVQFVTFIIYDAQNKHICI